MPVRGAAAASARKRKRIKDDPLASDSDDENFNDAPSPKATSRKSKPTGKGKKNTSSGRRRQDTYDDDEEDDDDEISDDDGESIDEDDEPVEVGLSGRPVRKARKSKATNYAEDDSEEVERVDEIEDDDEDQQAIKPKNSRKNVRTEAPPTKKLVIKLRVGPAQVGPKHEASNPPPRRSTRAASANAQTRPTTSGKAPTKTTGTRGGSVGPPTGTALTTRRSSRLGHDNEPFVNSGKHTEVLGHEAVILEEGETSLETSATHISSNGDYKREEEDSILSTAAVHGSYGSNAIDNLDQSVPAEVTVEVPATDTIEAEEDLDAPGDEESVQGDLDAGHEADEDEDVLPSKRTRTRSIGGSGLRDSTISPRTTRSAADRERALTMSADKRSHKDSPSKGGKRLGRLRKSTRGGSRKAGGESDEDEYREEEGSGDEELSSDAGSPKAPRSTQAFIAQDDEDYSEANNTRRGRSQGKRPEQAASQLRSKRRLDSSDHEQVSQAEQLEAAEELEELRPSPKRRRATRGSGPSGGEAPDRTLRRRAQPVDYRIMRPEAGILFDEPEGGASTPSRRRTGAAAAPGKSLFDTFGPFGGGSGPVPLFGRPGKFSNLPLDIDSDSSDDERMQKPSGAGGMPGIGGGMGMTPTTAAGPGLLPSIAQTHNMDALQGTPANLGKVTKPAKQTLADADPLGVATDITFDSVGGLDDKIHQLKEMVQLPLSYPEIFAAKNMTPPRGVLFYGPPGTGKTLMARALAASCSSESRKVTFYMRKGADCLSKWVGEAERQLRLLFEEAKNNQPSIIFFDEIDGLAPVRSSKQEQIHASIVSTLLALMDGMDGRGQVVVIGATNRPDAIDPALRRPGRFDREFYFPLPATEARRKIIDIHTKGWEPPLENAFKDQLAELTKGYGGADLRALCTEAALNAVQRTYPQIYMTPEKLKVDAHSIKVLARDFMVSLKNMVPSSERSSSSGASPLPRHIEPLLSSQLDSIKDALQLILPDRKRLSVFEEALLEDDMGIDGGFEREKMMSDFETARVFRPRLLIHGPAGMGQHYIAAAILHHLEKVHVQSFDLATLMGDATRSMEAAIVQLFVEVKRRKPSVIFVPEIDMWYSSLSDHALATFRGLLQSIPANEPILFLGITEQEVKALSSQMLTEFFGYSRKDRFELGKPDKDARFQYFDNVISHIRKAPTDFPPDANNRKKRVLEVLEKVAPPPPREMTKEEIKAQEQKDRQIKNWLKIRLNPMMESIKQRYRRFKKPVIEYDLIKHLLDPPPPPDVEIIASDIPPPPAQERYRIFFDDTDEQLRVQDTVANKTYYNLDIDVIEERLSNGFYCTTKQFLQDLEHIRYDADISGDKERKMKANEMLTNAEVFVADVEMDAGFILQCEDMFRREQKKRAEIRAKRERKAKALEDAREAAEKVASSANRPSNGSPAKSKANSHESPSNGGSFNSNGALEDGTIPSSNPENELQSHDHANVPATPHSRMDPRLDMDSSWVPFPSQQSGSNRAATQLTQMSAASGASVGLTPFNNGIGGSGSNMVLNYASSTTSGQRTSDGAQQRSTNHSNSNGTQNSNSFINPNLEPVFPNPEQNDSQLPDTQIVASSSSDLNSSQSLASQSTPRFSIESQAGSLSQGSQFGSFTAPPIFELPAPKAPKLILDNERIDNIHHRLSESTSGYSVEQLEQVNAAMMDAIWKSRILWNRNEVADKAMEAFEEVDKDIREFQQVMTASGSF
ncbi:AAA-domain-containing protein [Morchella conica CCBAS932]|uniref:AAA-domain-containing protein n=1 Tax=Morchella conica CCBAS932 TaxID=1392247 RepID=A0A3N4KLS3_9PEZI|nr:AAA-domain-containing protein [Morchella conica CCBAS932]